MPQKHSPFIARFFQKIEDYRPIYFLNISKARCKIMMPEELKDITLSEVFKWFLHEGQIDNLSKYLDSYFSYKDLPNNNLSLQERIEQEFNFWRWKFGKYLNRKLDYFIQQDQHNITITTPLFISLTIKDRRTINEKLLTVFNNNNDYLTSRYMRGLEHRDNNIITLSDDVNSINKLYIPFIIFAIIYYMYEKFILVDKDEKYLPNSDYDISEEDLPIRRKFNLWLIMSHIQIGLTKI